MSTKTFKLPDLGEGLPEAEIVTWHVAEGDSVSVDQLMVSVETAKAVVDVPSPYAGSIKKLYAQEGDIVKTHAALVDFTVEGPGVSSGDGEQIDETANASPTTDVEIKTVDIEEDSGTVVGKMQTSDAELVEKVRIGSKRRRERKQATASNFSVTQSQPASAHGKFKATPSVRLAAKQQGIDLSQVPPSGKFGQVTQSDLRAFASRPQDVLASGNAPSHLPQSGLLQRQQTDVNFGEAERLRGPRRAMNLSMSASRDQVSQCTLFDDADIHYWLPGQDITARVLRALTAGAFAAPELNAWFNADNGTRTLHQHIDVAMAVDTPDGLIVPVLRSVESKNLQQLRADLNEIKVATRNRSVSPAQMAKPTITLSNFGMLAGRYATPVIVPPMVCILGTGGLRHDVVAVMGGIEVHKRLPLSLTFDHRCITGGEACRFLAAMIKDLEKPF
ncbi:MAG: 2-oxo acid dehydrogenase subunit E2 [Gammaproteobacteria bacterium]|nr:2-oxo acid dehydrogenase subunit E2 [Gammaproteobacteria bacterium]NNM12803.1 2-oxo acid dehydrogenase subunit E2 [Gammaproteobacteria bacterium]